MFSKLLVLWEVILFTSARQSSPHQVGYCTGYQQFDYLKVLYIFLLLFSIKDANKCKGKRPGNMTTRKVPLSIVQISNIVFSNAICY